MQDNQKTLCSKFISISEDKELKVKAGSLISNAIQTKKKNC